MPRMKRKLKTSKTNNIEITINKIVNKKPYTLKPPLEVRCIECKSSLTVLFCPPRQCYSHKNDWGWWTQKSEDQGSYKCDNCIIDMYKHRKYEYLEAITNSKKRGLLRSYLYNSIVE